MAKTEDMQALWREYRRTGDQALRDRLILTYAPLVKYVAGRVGSGLPAHVDEGDLVQYGLLGLISAIERFDPDRDIKFETYAISRIKGAIIDELRAMDWVPRSVRARAREIERAIAELEKKLMRAPTDQEIADKIGHDPARLQEERQRMPEPGKIRNVAVVGHRGTGKTSLVEAMLFQAGATNRLGTVEAGTTVSDWDEDEQRRQMSLSAALCHVEWQGRKINLVDAPGDAGFIGDAVAALRVVEGALMTVSGVMGVEVQTGRLWKRADELGLARVVFVNMLDRERADFFRTLEALRAQLSDKCVAVHIPIGAEHDLEGIVDVLHMKAYTSPDGGKEGDPTEIPADVADQAQEYREKLLDAVVETDEALMERYLEGEELPAEDVAHALKEAVTRGDVFPVACGVATKNLGTTALLDLLVEGVPSPAKKGTPIEVDGAGTAAFVFKTIADPFAGKINVFRVLSGTLKADSTLVDA